MIVLLLDQTGKLPAHRAALPGYVNMITGSAFLPAPAAARRGIQPT